MARQSQRTSTKPPARKPAAAAQRSVARIGRNQRCPCGSGKKYKECHLSAGQEFLAKLAQEEDRKRRVAKRQEMKADGVPWHKRIFAA